MEIVNTHATLMKVRVRQHSHKWISREVLALMKSRNYYLKKFRKTRNPNDWEAYQGLRNAVKMGLIDAKKKYLEGICKEHTTQPKRVWNELNKILSRNVQS